MRILVLSRNPALYSTSRLVLAGRARGHRVTVLDPLRLQIAAAGRQQGLRCDGRPLARYDAVIPRIGASITGYGQAVLQQFPAQTWLMNDAAALILSRDKLLSLQVLRAARLRVPRTVCLRSLEQLTDAVKLVGGFPLVLKLQRGTQGVGVMLVPSMTAASGLMETLLSMGHDLLLQQYVAEAAGSDVRAFVVGEQVVAAMRRTAADGDFRANLHRGGSGEAITLSAAQRRVAVRAAQCCGLHVAGVDMLITRAGPVVIELNSSPGLEGIETICQRDVASDIIRYAEGQVAKTPTHRQPAAGG